ncbi:MAG TPA: hypothetical protein H9717_11010 [Candidatus Eisenbergiella merdipullorum]|uniref:Glycosyltransferase n=1 Tax=Candidatus Eisenbergiella merdipullorum TaxID=2838553 RepID=A0A9D2I5E3_9FIRM|nr:hypothetical protein [Candidatus Eisenbergiella merdipullorum]
MEALILSCGTGGGHHSAARAVADELRRRGHTAVMLDPFTLAGRKTAALVGNSYIRLVQNAPRLFGLAYSLGECYRRLPVHSPVYEVNSLLSKYMKRYLEQNPFDVIFMTHLYPAHILTALQKQGTALPKTIQIATDYTCIPFLEEGISDYYIIPSAELAHEFTERGIPAEKLLPFGIPVNRKFTLSFSRKEARKRLGLPEDGLCLLLAGGSIGAGDIPRSAEILRTWLNSEGNGTLVIICGKRRGLYQSLCRKYQSDSRVLILESTPRMAEYMRACDVFFSKPGGLSSTEAAVSGVPLILLSPIPGCETHNAAFFSSHKMALTAKHPQTDLIPALTALQDDPGLKEEMLEAQHRYINPNSTRDLCDFAEKLV